MDVFDGTSQLITRNWATTVQASAVQTATNNTPDMYNYNHHGAQFSINMTAVPGVVTVTPHIQGKDPASGVYYDILVGPAIVANGNYQLKIKAGATPVANAAVSDEIPFVFRVLFVHSGAGSFTYSAGLNLQI